MASLLLKGGDLIPTGVQDSTIDVTNWRAVGSFRQNDLCVVTENFAAFIVKNLTLKKFTEIVRLNLDFPTRGDFVGISLACSKCSGLGITDWISKAVDGSSNKRVYGSPIMPFKRDPDGILYEAPITIQKLTFNCYFSTAFIPEAHEHCDLCRGNGTHQFSKTLKVGNVKEVRHAIM